MTWGPYFMFYECPKCGRKYRWELVDLSDPQFGCCPGCGSMGMLVGESKDIKQGERKYEEFEYC